MASTSRHCCVTPAGGSGTTRLTQAASAESTGSACAGSRLLSGMRVGCDYHRHAQRPEKTFIQHARAQPFTALRSPRTQHDEIRRTLGGAPDQAVHRFSLHHLITITDAALGRLTQHALQMRADLLFQLRFEIAPESVARRSVVEPVIALHALPEIRHHNQVVQDSAGAAEGISELLRRPCPLGAVAGEQDMVWFGHGES